MTAADVGRTNFQNGMRVAREHLDHLQVVLRDAAEASRRTAGAGKVCFGLRVKAAGADAVSVEAGAAFDRAARVLLAEAADVQLSWGAGTRLFLVLEHRLRAGEDQFNGQPTRYSDAAEVDVRAVSPPYDDDGVVFAQLDRSGDVVDVTQKGEWFLAPLDHTHSGAFVERDGLWRYDGHQLGYPPARFDSGFVPVSRSDSIALTHGLGADADLLVQIQARADGVVTSAGHGTSHWYELAPGEVRLVRGSGGPANLDLRAMIWPLHAATGGPLLPLAEPGPDLVVEPGESFTLDASASRAFGGKKLKTFIWTEIT